MTTYHNLQLPRRVVIANYLDGVVLWPCMWGPKQSWHEFMGWALSSLRIKEVS